MSETTLTPIVCEATEDPLLAPYYRRAAEGVLALPRCPSCAEFHWYPKACCPHCQARDLTWTEVRPEAHLFSWTVVEHAFESAYQAHIPFIVALVVPLDASNVRLAVNLCDCSAGELQIGSTLRASFRRALIGEHMVPWFLPASLPDRTQDAERHAVTAGPSQKRKADSK
jgi:uncharacterized protein